MLQDVSAGGHILISGNVYTRSDLEELEEYLTRAVSAYERDMSQTIIRMSMPPHPYKFLDPFDLKDEPIFFGREAATKELYTKALRDRLTVLHAKSGAGKTSLLKAGLSPRFIREGRLPLYAHAYYQDEDPVMAIKRVIASAAHGPWPRLLRDLPLDVFLGLVCARLGRDTYELIVILDQFEQFFILWSQPEARRAFIKALSICYDNQQLPLRFIIALRKDYYSDLGEFGRVVPHLHVFRNEYWLNTMTLEEVQAAITRPLAKQADSVTYEPALLEMLLVDLARSGMELPLLQIICTRLYETRGAGEAHIPFKTYETLGRAEGVLKSYLNSQLAEFPGREESLARSVLKELVRSDATKQVLSDKTLATRVEVQRDELDDVLYRLVNLRLLHRDEMGGEVLYELAHEYLTTEIVKWMSPADQEFKQAEELLQRELVNWRILHVPIPRNRLAVLYPYRERFKDVDIEAWRCLISSALTEDFAVADWIKTAGDIGELVLAQTLKTVDAPIRRRGVKRLGEVGDPRVVESLIAALKDEDQVVRWRAVEALKEIGGPAVEPLIAALKDEDPDVCQLAAETLREIGDPAVEPLIAVLADASWRTSGSSDEDPDVRWQAAKVLGKIGDPAVEPLIVALADEHQEGRWLVAEALGKIGDPRAVEPLIVALADEHQGVRCQAAEALGEIRGPRTVEPLIAALKDKDRVVRGVAAEALGKIGDLRAVEPLIAALKDEDHGVQGHVAEALGKIGDLRAVEPLIAALADVHWATSHSVAQALGAIGGSAVEPLIAALKDKHQQVRQLAAEALGEIRSSRAVEPLIAALKDKHQWVRREATKALWKIGTPKAVSALENARKEGMGKPRQRSLKKNGQ
jgi:HEAT repeat protein